MFYKQLEPGMIIHCETESEVNCFRKYLIENGYLWRSTRSLERWFPDMSKDGLCFKLYESKYIGYSDPGFYYRDGEDVTKFSELLEERKDLDSEKIKQILGKCHELCDNHNCERCPMRDVFAHKFHTNIKRWVNTEEKGE